MVQYLGELSKSKQSPTLGPMMAAMYRRHNGRNEQVEVTAAEVRFRNMTHLVSQ